MVSPLETLLKTRIAAGFHGQLLTGTLRQVTAGSGVDEFGDAIGDGYEDFEFEGIVDTYTAFYRAQAGIPDTDVRVLVIAGSVSAKPRKGDKVRMRSPATGAQTWFEVIAVSGDPAGASFDLQSREIEEPS